MIIKYGITDIVSIDITNVCSLCLNNNNIITIPSGEDNRSLLYTDPYPGVLKKIFIILNENIHEYEYFYTIKINSVDNTITLINDYDIDNILQNIHSSLNIKYGNFKEEYNEQKMVVRYLTGNEKVLEIGGNIGRNSLIIASILGNNNNNNFVTLESDFDIANLLIENRDLNNFTFHIEPSALSKRKLIQNHWRTVPSDTLKNGFHFINTITLDELKKKYNIDFDTLVLDCEGAFYYILMDMPEILNNIRLIIMENDYIDMSHKKYVRDTFKKNNFYRDFIDGGNFVYENDNFYEVWKRNVVLI
jgi:FkbM family methyltransferase